MADDYHGDNTPKDEEQIGKKIWVSVRRPIPKPVGKQERTPKAIGRCPKCGVALTQFPCLDCQING